MKMPCIQDWVISVLSISTFALFKTFLSWSYSKLLWCIALIFVHEQQIFNQKYNFFLIIGKGTLVYFFTALDSRGSNLWKQVNYYDPMKSSFYKQHT